MLKWTLIFCAFSLIAGVFGFTSIAVTTSGIAQILFYIFIVLLVFTLLARVANAGDKLIK